MKGRRLWEHCRAWRASVIRMLDFLFPPRADMATLRDVSTNDFLSRVKTSLVSETQPHTTVLLPFGDAYVRAAIHEAKYHGDKKALDFLAATLADYLLDADYGFTKPIIIPLPLGKKRRTERGFNQIEEIVLRATKNMAIPVDTTFLERTRETVSQVSLPRKARKENMRGAFKTTRPSDPSCTYIIIDDVVTTGATLQATIDALTSSGATHILPLALAH